MPGAGLTDYESMGLASKTDRFTGGGMERLGTGAFNQGNQSKQFDRLEQFAKLMRPPAVNTSAAFRPKLVLITGDRSKMVAPRPFAATASPPGPSKATPTACVSCRPSL